MVGGRAWAAESRLSIGHLSNVPRQGRSGLGTHTPVTTCPSRSHRSGPQAPPMPTRARRPRRRLSLPHPRSERPPPPGRNDPSPGAPHLPHPEVTLDPESPHPPRPRTTTTRGEPQPAPRPLYLQRATRNSRLPTPD